MPRRLLAVSAKDRRSRASCGGPNSPAIRAVLWLGALYDYANSVLPWPGSGLADLLVILAQPVMEHTAVAIWRAQTVENREQLSCVRTVRFWH
jgi:hypothetical protein